MRIVDFEYLLRLHCVRVRKGEGLMVPRLLH